MKPKQQLLEAQLAALAALRWLMTTSENDAAAHVGYLTGTLERIAGLHDSNDFEYITKLTKASRYATQSVRDEYNEILLARIKELTP